VQLREQLRLETIKDELTGLLNRRGFVALGQHALSLAEREKRKLLVIFIDLDGMKGINDQFGHHRGDSALVDTGNLLRRTFRKSDVVARMGGDEFAVIAQCKNDNDKAHIQRRLRENLDAIYKKAIGPYKLSLSIGMVEYNPAESCGLDALMEEADAAMYEVKRLKRSAERTAYFESA
jgi:diguanylate cyclase (GGDEF)-like protein